MQTGPITKRGKAKSSKNAIKHGLSSLHLISDEERIFYESTLQELTDEYQPKTFTERALTERMAKHYVRLQRAFNAEAAYIESENMSFGGQLPIQQTFDLTDEQTQAYALAWSKGSLSTKDDQAEETKIVTEATFKELIKLKSMDGFADTSVLENASTLVGVIFQLIARSSECTVDELFDGRYTPHQLLQSTISIGKEPPEAFPVNPKQAGRPIRPDLFLEDMFKEFGELTIARNIYPSVLRLEQLTKHIGLGERMVLRSVRVGDKYVTWK